MTANIGFLTYALDRAPGGIGRYTRELLDALRRNGLAPITLQAGRTHDDEQAIGLPAAGLLPGLLTVGQVEIAWIARQQHLDVIHDPTGTTPLGLARARRVVTIHDVIPYIYPTASTRLDRLIYRTWLPFALRQVDAIITVSECSKADIVRVLGVQPEQVSVIGEAANPGYRPLEAAKTQAMLQRYGINFPYILYVGSIEARKNLVRLLEAYAHLRTWSQGWELVIVGARKWQAGPVLDTLQRLKLQEYVHLPGFVAEEALPALYNGADLFIFPSLYEGFGLPVLEAMACGTPVVTSNTSSLPEVAGDAGLQVDPLDVEAIAQAMRRVLEDASLAADLRARGLHRAQQFSWERTAQETIAVYEQVLGRSVTGDSR